MKVLKMKKIRLETRVTENEKEFVVRLAKIYKMTISEVIRYCITLNYVVVWTQKRDKNGRTSKAKI